jgi:uncharacterized membrane protein
MFEITTLINNIASNIVLMFLKSLLNTLITYPANVIILGAIILIMIIKSLKGCFKRNIDIKEIKNMKD